MNAVVPRFLAICVLLHAWADSDARIGVDRTQEPYTSGRDVVDAVVDTIKTSCIFADDKLFLRRLAYVLSKDGTKGDTYTNDYYGGIWKVSEMTFKQTQNNTALSKQYVAIKATFGIVWNDVAWEDLLMPFYSGLCTRLFLNLLPTIPRSIEEQQTFIKNHVLNGLKLASTSFVESLKLFNDTCTSNGMDLVFVLDGSGSVGPSNFGLVKLFVQAVVSALEVDKNGTRVGIIQYSKNVRTELFLNTHYRTMDVLKTTMNMKHMRGSTNTAAALERMTTTIFTESHGARPRNSGKPRIGIVVTDGKSDNGRKTAEAALRAHDNNIIIFAVGVTSSIDKDELKIIGSDPDCTHVFILNNFREINSFVHEIEQSACKEPAPIDFNQTIQGVIKQNQHQYFTMDVDVDEGCRFKLGSTKGDINMYMSTQNRNPSSAAYQWTLPVSAGSEDELYVTPDQIKRRSRRSVGQVPMYATIEGDTDQDSQFTLQTSGASRAYGIVLIVASLVLSVLTSICH